MSRLHRLMVYLPCLFLASWGSHSTSGLLLHALVLIVLVERLWHSWAHGFSSQNRPWKWVNLLLLFIAATVCLALMRPGVIPWWEATYRGLVLAVLAWVIYKPGRSRWSWACLLLVGLVLIPPAAALHPLHTVPKRTPAALGLTYEEVAFRTSDGLVLRGWLMPHPEARGNVVCCHGHGRNRGHLIGMWQTLHDLKLNVLVFDFRGHGWSEGHTCTLGQGEVDDVVAAEAFLRQRCPEKPSFLVGISMGAVSALRALPRLPTVRGVWSEGAFARLGTVVDHEFAILPDWVRRPLVEAYKLLGWLDCDLTVEKVNPVDSLEGLTVPVFFCHGEEDALIPFSEGQMLDATYTGPHQHWWVAEATHHNIRQHHSTEYLQRLRDFLEEHLQEASKVTPSATPPS